MTTIHDKLQLARTHTTHADKGLKPSLASLFFERGRAPSVRISCFQTSPTQVDLNQGPADRSPTELCTQAKNSTALAHSLASCGDFYEAARCTTDPLPDLLSFFEGDLCKRFYLDTSLQQLFDMGVWQGLRSAKTPQSNQGPFDSCKALQTHALPTEL